MAIKRGLLSVFFAWCFSTAAFSSEDIAQAVGQKIMLDLRYYCQDGTPGNRCRTPVTALTPAIKSVLVKGHIGGVVLFAENLENVEQIVSLNYELQALAKNNGLPPFFIAIDQEGGRVARLPASIATRFVGNMAIGATYQQHKTRYATEVNTYIAQRIKQLGFNVNFAPVLDVNNNPDNPVINVRAYSESPQVVAELGVAAVKATQAQGVLSAVKHFPGHGDTHTDSHTGLPRVEHDLADVTQTELVPFMAAIESDSPPAMVMTAHIQYPALDSATRIGVDGKARILPATLSHRILTGLLRGKLGYQGLIVTDAMDMAGIAHYFDATTATIEAFKAGVDIVLMPYRIRNPEEIQGFWQWHGEVIKAVEQGAISRDQLQASASRIASAKVSYQLADFIAKPMAVRLSEINGAIMTDNSKTVELQLARDALTVVKGKNTLPLALGNWRLVMPDQARCDAMIRALNNVQRELSNISSRDFSLNTHCLSLATVPTKVDWQAWQQADVVVVGDISPQYSAVEMGGMDDLAVMRHRADKNAQYQFIRTMLAKLTKSKTTTVTVALRAPYVLDKFLADTKVAIATLGYNVEVENGEAKGAVYQGLAEVLLGRQKAQGQLPVSIQ